MKFSTVIGGAVFLYLFVFGLCVADQNEALPDNFVETENKVEMSSCNLNPQYTLIKVPESELRWTKQSDVNARICESIPENEWLSTPINASTVILVHPRGPSGSGRNWTITLGFAAKNTRVPERGICLFASTVGWRTLQDFHRLPLPWVADINNDDKPELFIWDSFPLEFDDDGNPLPPPAWGLIAWVYDINLNNNNLLINWELSRKMATELSVAYRKRLKNESETIHYYRPKAANVLQRFAEGQCNVDLPNKVNHN